MWGRGAVIKLSSISSSLNSFPIHLDFLVSFLFFDSFYPLEIGDGDVDIVLRSKYREPIFIGNFMQTSRQELSNKHF